MAPSPVPLLLIRVFAIHWLRGVRLKVSVSLRTASAGVGPRLERLTCRMEAAANCQEDVTLARSRGWIFSGGGSSRRWRRW